MNIKAISRIIRSTVAGTVFFLSLVLVPVLTNAQEAAAYPTDEATVKAGEKLFKLNCKSCHNIDSDMTGPALQGVTERHSIDWIKSWVRGPKTMVESGDKEAVALYNKWKSSGYMTAFNLKDDEILSIMGYIETWAPPVVETALGTDIGNPETPAMSDDTITLVLGIVLVVLVLIIIVLVLISALVMKSLKGKELSEDETDFVEQKHNLLTVITHPAFIGIVVLLAVVVGLLFGVKKGLYGVGVQQSYAPTQPIPFSHKIHAGDHEIDCNYCHTGVRKAKHANIPSPNICMNCHNQIKKDSPWIAKIYEAIDYNPSTGEYGTNVKPIEWVRVHNLPDLVYFNHQQHVKVGQIECETCHGPIKEMDVVYQYSPLTMGWCIDCHRKTDVQAQGNDYYDALLKAHEASGKKEPMKVEDIGGLECSKCHY